MKEIEQSSPKQNASIENPGRFVCNQLKSIRRHIAKENGIRLEIPKCKFKGECDGTCPRCDAELQYLEQELSRRSFMGKSALVAGMAVGLSLGSHSVAAQTQPSDSAPQKIMSVANNSKSDSCVVSGKVVDENDEPLMIANILFKDKDELVVCGCRTNFDGEFSCTVPQGHYQLQVQYLGYKIFEWECDLTADSVSLGSIIMSRRKNFPKMTTGLVKIKTKCPMIRIGEPESGERIDSDRINHMPTP